MSRFYAEIQGNRGPATRCGSKSSGVWSHTRGWNVGVKVYCHVNEDGEDEIHVYRTSGSNGSGHDELLSVVRWDGVNA